MNESPATASLRSATPKKNVPCFSDLARDRFFLKKERTFFFGVLPVKIFGQCGGAKCGQGKAKTIFAGGKGFALPRLLFQNGGDLVSAAQEGAGGMRGGFAGLEKEKAL